MNDIRPPRNGRRPSEGRARSGTYNRIVRFDRTRPHVYVRVGNYEFCFMQMHGADEDEYDLDVGRFVLEYAPDQPGQPARVRRIHESDDLLDPLESIYELAFDVLDAGGFYARSPGIPAHLVRYIGDLDRRVDQLRRMGRRE